MTYILGLTGGIGAGKSTLTQKYSDIVFDCDKETHKLYKNQEIVFFLEKNYGPMYGKARETIRDLVYAGKVNLKDMEKIFLDFLSKEFKKFCEDKDFVICDAPVLFESKWDTKCHTIVSIIAPEKIRWERVKDRKGIDYTKFKFIVSKQISDDERNERSDFVIDGTQSKENVLESFEKILEKLKNEKKLKTGIDFCH